MSPFSDMVLKPQRLSTQVRGKSYSTDGNGAMLQTQPDDPEGDRGNIWSGLQYGKSKPKAPESNCEVDEKDEKTV